MEYFEQLKLNRPLLLKGILPTDIDFEYAGLSSPSPRLSIDDKLTVLMFEPLDFDLPRSVLILLLLLRRGVDRSDTICVPKNKAVKCRGRLRGGIRGLPTTLRWDN